MNIQAFTPQVHAYRPRFTGHSTQSPTRSGAPVTPTSTEKRLQQLRQDLEQLRQDPNIEFINVDSIVKLAKRYLLQRAINPNLPFCIGVGGPSAAGKSTITEWIEEQFEELQQKKGTKLPTNKMAHRVLLDSFYKDKSDKKASLGVEAFLSTVDLDSPDAWDMGYFQKSVNQLKQSKPLRLGIYDYTIAKINNHKPVPKAKIYLFDGAHTLNSGNFDGSGIPLHEAFDLKLYIHTSPEVMDKRWEEREVSMRDEGISSQTVNTFYQNVLKNRTEFIDPTQSNADIVLNTLDSKASIEKTSLALTNILYKNLFSDSASKKQLDIVA